jgi:hypothetical protein
MRKFSFRLLVVSLFSLALMTTAVVAQSGTGVPTFEKGSLLSSQAANQPDQERAKQSLAGLQIPFITNESQLDPRVSYYAPTFAGTVYVTHDGKIVYSLPGHDKDSGWSLTEKFEGGKLHPRGEGATPTRVSSFIGNDPARWKTDVATYDSVSLGEVWPGVDVRLRAHGRNAEKLFRVRPGVNPSRIRMRVAGASSLRVNSAGALVATTGLGEVTFTPPLAYQEIGGIRREVDVAYDVRSDTYGFRLGSFDPKLAVVIDPLLQATYLGGSRGASGAALAIHPVTGEVFVAGSTSSTDFPGTAGGAQPTGNVFVARLNATLTTLYQATYLGGSGGSQANALAIHPTTGEVFVTGQTGPDFPGTAGGAQPVFRGVSDAFVARLNATLTSLKQATYLGGSGQDSGRAVTIDPTTGDVFVAGDIRSADLPGTAGGAQPTYGGGPCTEPPLGGDAFVARFNAALTTLKKATYLGGSCDDIGSAIALDPETAEVFVTGYTLSSDFPGTVGGAQSEKNVGPGGTTAFVARLSPDLTTLDQSTYLGGSIGDYAQTIAIHPLSRNVYVAGSTSSADFPGTPGGTQPIANIAPGSSMGFVARLNRSLTTILQSTFLGGGGDQALSLAISPKSADVYAAGLTLSRSFPGTAGGAQATYGGGYDDAFVAWLNADLTTLKKATYLGGYSYDDAAAVAISPTMGDVYVAGTTSGGLPGTIGGAQAVLRGGEDAFVARLTSDLTEGSLPALLNSYLSFNSIPSTFHTSPATIGCSGGTFSFKAKLTNTSAHSLSHLAVKVTALTNGDLLQNADGRPGGVGAQLTIPAAGAYADGMLAPGESVDVSFDICLQTKGAFTFLVDVLGRVE